MSSWARITAVVGMLSIASACADTNDPRGTERAAQAATTCPEATTPDAHGEPRNAAGHIRYCWPGEALCHCDQDNDCYAQPGYVACTPPTDAGTAMDAATTGDAGTCPPEPTTLDSHGEPRNAAGDVRYCWPGEAFCHCDQDNDCYARAGYVPCTPGDAGRDAAPMDAANDVRTMDVAQDANRDAGVCPPEQTTLDSHGEPRNAAGDIRYCWPGEAFCHCDQDNDCYARAGYVPCTRTDAGVTDARTDSGVDTGTDARTDSGVDAAGDAGRCPPETATLDANGVPRTASGDIRYCFPGEAFCACDIDNDCYPRTGWTPCGSTGRVTSVDFTVNPSAAIVNGTVTIRASSVGSTNPRYHFFAVTPGGTYTEPCGGYTYVNTCAFRPTVSGDWRVTVSARDAASNATFEATTAERLYAVGDVAASIGIDATLDLGAVNRSVYGANFEYIGANVPAIDAVVEGTHLIRFPGGDGESNFLWSDVNAGTCAVPQWTWPTVAPFAARHGMALALETNLVRGSATNAADWVADARARGLEVAWVGVGNEPWGSFDAGFRTPAAYAADVRAYASAIRARVPGTRIVAAIGTFNNDAWNRSVIRAIADVIDAVDYHYYPNHEANPDPMEVAAGADGIVPLINRIRAMLQQEAPTQAARIQILFGEYDGANDGARFPPVEANRSFAVWSMADALFYGAAIGEMFEANLGAAMFYEMQGYRYGAVGGNACLTADYRILRPKALALQLYREHFGDRRVAVTPRSVPTYFSDGPTQWDGFNGTAPLVRSYASLAANGASLRLVVVTRSATQRVTVAFDLAGFVPTNIANAWQVAGSSITATNENVGGPIDAVRIVPLQIPTASPTFGFTAAAHSITAVELTRR